MKLTEYTGSSSLSRVKLTARNHLSFFLILISVSLVCLPLIVYGPQTGGDFHLQLPWSYNFATQVVNGDIYPRWLMNINAGAGGPTFFYYGPIAFYFGVIANIACSSCSANVQLGIAQYLILLSAAFAFFIYIRQYVHPLISALGAVLYTFLPYHFSLDLLYRQAHTEAASYIWIPLLFWATDKLIQDKKAAPFLAASYALLILTHLPTALMSSFFLGVYMLTKSWSRRSISLYTYFAASIITGILLSGCYLTPALSTQDLIHSKLWWGQHFDYSRWFFLDGMTAPDQIIDALLHKILIYNTLAFAVAWLVSTVTGLHKRTILLPITTVFLGAWFLMTPVSSFMWEFIPIVKKIQFPWRVLTFQDFSLAAVVSLAISSLHKIGMRWASITLITLYTVLLASAMAFTISAYRPHQVLWEVAERQEGLELLAQSGAGARAHFPIAVSMDFQSFLDNLPEKRVTLFDSTGSVTIERWNPRDISLSFNLPEKTLVTVKQIYYRGWEALNSTGHPIYIIPHPQFGLIQFIAEPGHYTVELELKPLASEQLGWSITSIGLVFLLLLYALRYRQS